MVRVLATLVAGTVAAAGLTLVPVVEAAAASTGSAYVPPVRPPAAVVVDHFRAPPTPYAPGNRGLDYAVVPGTRVVASAAGVVVFAGAVGGALHVTIAHPDGLRTTYSFLARVLVTRSQAVHQGQVVGVAGPTFHFGVRDSAGDYLDPELLFAGHLGAHLVPGPDEGAAPLVDDTNRERSELLQVVRDLIARAGGPVAALVHEEQSLLPMVSSAQLADELADLARSQRRCTPGSVQVPPPAGRRVAVLVGGLGSTGASASVDRVDTSALGYRSGDVLRFSYAGGRVPSPRDARRGAVMGRSVAWSSIPVHTYRRHDTEVDLRVAADRLVDLLAQVAAAAPGTPIDVIAHSEGGVVTRLALDQAVSEGRLPPQLGLVVTIATPHQGADAATALEAATASPGAAVVLRGAAGMTESGVDLDGPAVSQLSQVSPIAAELARDLPPGVRMLSLGASGDLTVPWVRTRAPGATPVLVDLSGPSAHERLPGAAATTRAIALALAGRPPACLGRLAAVRGVITSHLAAQGEDAVGLTLGLTLQP